MRVGGAAAPGAAQRILLYKPLLLLYHACDGGPPLLECVPPERRLVSKPYKPVDHPTNFVPERSLIFRVGFCCLRKRAVLPLVSMYATVGARLEGERSCHQLRGLAVSDLLGCLQCKGMPCHHSAPCTALLRCFVCSNWPAGDRQKDQAGP